MVWKPTYKHTHIRYILRTFKLWLPTRSYVSSLQCQLTNSQSKYTYETNWNAAHRWIHCNVFIPFNHPVLFIHILPHRHRSSGCSARHSLTHTMPCKIMHTKTLNERRVQAKSSAGRSTIVVVRSSRSSYMSQTTNQFKPNQPAPHAIPAK